MLSLTPFELALDPCDRALAKVPLDEHMIPFDCAQIEVLRTVYDLEFTTKLPRASRWDQREALTPAVFQEPKNPFQVAETLGDAAMHLAVPVVLRRLHPNIESPLIFTVSCLS